MPQVRLKYIRAMAFGFWVGFISAVFGLFFGLLFGLVSYVNMGFRNGYQSFLVLVLVTPVVFAVIGLLASLSSAIVYNAFVRRRGGVFFEFEDLETKADLPPPPPRF